MAAIGVALSGGGHRATTWALGALMYLADAGRNREVVSIASVSGGSIANGVVAHEMDYSAADGMTFRAAVRPVLRLIANKGLFAWGPATNWYLWLLILAGLGLAVSVVGVLVNMVDALHGTPPSAGRVVRWLLAAVVAWLATLLLFSARSVVVDRALRRVLFSRDGVATPLRAVRGRVGHVFCATELQSADHLYFAPEFVSTYRLGVGEPADLTLATAVQCSACLPGAFRPRRLPAARHHLRPFPHVKPEVRTDTLVLQDGGVYDNMADQWHQGFTDRLARWPELAQVQTPPDVLLVVNASAGWVWEPFRRRGLVLGEVAAMLRAKDILYDGTTAQRRRNLVARFDRAAETGQGLRGVLVHIPQSPWDVAEALSRSADQARAGRARDVLALLQAGPITREEWAAIAARSADVRTTLGKLGEGPTAELLQHAYVLAMCNAHIVLDFPLLALPPREDFLALLR